MAEKEYVCGYNHCLHNGEKVKESESVVINKKHYHWDCAMMKQEIRNCVDAYMDYTEDKTQFPLVSRIINTLVFKNRVPTEFILHKIQASESYYKTKPPQVLYGLRKLYWEKL